MKDLNAKSRELVQKFIDGYRIKAIGGIIYGFKQGAKDHGNPIVAASDGPRCRDILNEIGISMRRVDAGGSPEWEFAAH